MLCRLAPHPESVSLWISVPTGTPLPPPPFHLCIVVFRQLTPPYFLLLSNLNIFHRVFELVSLPVLARCTPL